MAPTALYTICVLGAAAMFLSMRSGKRALVLAGAVLGIGAFAWFLVLSMQVLAPETGQRPEFFYTIFSLIAIACSLRMITHRRPVYCALYFVMVVLSSAALFLLLAAEFIAFALVIVYAGAILVTYMFVLMLAQQSPDPSDPEGAAEYDRVPREPAAAAVVGFVVLAMLGNMTLLGPADLDEAASAHEGVLVGLMDLNELPRELESVADELEPGSEVVWRDDRTAVYIDAATGDAFVDLIPPGETAPRPYALSAEHIPGNVQLVGVALVAKFPVSLELAGIILLLAMFGAVVLARRQIELSEDELRIAAGLHRLTPEDDSDFDASGTGSEKGGER